MKAPKERATHGHPKPGPSGIRSPMEQHPGYQTPIGEAARMILESIGENPERAGLQATPRRVEKAFQFLTSGYGMNLEEIVGDAIFEESESNEIVLVRDIEIYSLCEHHMLPFYGKAHVAYLPNGKIIGLSKIPRIVDVFARRLQVQERLTSQISKAIDQILNPLGTAVIIEANHLCMMMRGVEKQNSKTVTSSVLGDFKDSEVTRQELMHLLHGFGLSR